MASPKLTSAMSEQDPPNHKVEEPATSTISATAPASSENPEIDLSNQPTDPQEADTTPRHLAEPANPHSKPCALCHTPKDVLIRCQVDSSKKWLLICTGKCWKEVSGGVVDGDRQHPDYKYGGMWKNKYEVASAKIKGKAKEENERGRYVKSVEHRRWGRSTRGKNKDSRKVVWDERTDGGGEEEEEQMEGWDEVSDSGIID